MPRHMRGLTDSQKRGIQRRTLYAERVLVAGRLVHPRAEHGQLSSYQNYGCRCVPCSDASMADRADRYARYVRRLGPEVS